MLLWTKRVARIYELYIPAYEVLNKNKRIPVARLHINPHTKKKQQQQITAMPYQTKTTLLLNYATNDNIARSIQPNNNNPATQNLRPTTTSCKSWRLPATKTLCVSCWSSVFEVCVWMYHVYVQMYIYMSNCIYSAYNHSISSHIHTLSHCYSHTQTRKPHTQSCLIYIIGKYDSGQAAISLGATRHVGAVCLI